MRATHICCETNMANVGRLVLECRALVADIELVRSSLCVIPLRDGGGEMATLQVFGSPERCVGEV